MYNRQKVYEYAKKWAYERNPQYYNYDYLGGDCTNFVSQCIYAGYNQMNYSKSNGWYYINGNNKSPSWTGVEFLYRFLTTNESVGPVGRDADLSEIQLGDVIFLSNGQRKYHTLVVTGFAPDGEILICAHTNDSYMRRLDSYNYYSTFPVHIEKVNTW